MLFAQSTISEIFSDSRNLGYMLWIGLAILTLTLIILMRTRWGQVKPISKCIMLSVFAHVLLIGYAYGTRLIFTMPEQQGISKGAIVELSFIDDEESLEQTKQEKPWNSFSGVPIDTPEMTNLQRPELAVQTEQPKRDTLAPIESQNDLQSRLTEEVSQKVVDTFEPIVTQQQPRQPSKQKVIVPQDAITTSHVNKADMAQAAIAKPEFAPDISAAELELKRVKESINRKDLVRSSPAPQEMHQQLTKLQTEVQQFGQQVINETHTVDDLAWSRNPQSKHNPFKLSGHKIRKSTNDNAVTKLNVRRLSDGQLIPKLYALRVSENRTAIAVKNGGNAESEKVVQSALKWLQANQSPDGRWDANGLEGGRETYVLGHNRGGAGADADTGITGLTLLAFLGAGNSHLEGEFQKEIQKGLEFLIRSQKQDGNMAGDARLFASMYCHGIATLALSEAYALTGDQRLKAPVQRALNYSVNTQHQRTGGWRYRPGDDGDMSQFGWQVMALKSGELAQIAIPVATKNKMNLFVNASATGTNGGLASYRPGEKASRTMTAEALCCRLFLELPINEEMKKEATDFLQAKLPADGKANYYYWYYGTMASYQLGGEPWDNWNKAMQSQLLKRQRKDGALAGSFDPDSMWGGYGGRAFTTAMSALCLEVYYRYLPILESK